MTKCAVFKCKSTRRHTKGTTFHQIPCDESVRKSWIQFVADSIGHDWSPGDYSAICGRHFVEADYLKGAKQRRLKSGSVPSLHQHYQQDEPANITHNQCTTSIEVKNQLNEIEATDEAGVGDCSVEVDFYALAESMALFNGSNCETFQELIHIDPQIGSVHVDQENESPCGVSDCNPILKNENTMVKDENCHAETQTESQMTTKGILHFSRKCRALRARLLSSQRKVSSLISRLENFQKKALAHNRKRQRLNKKLHLKLIAMEMNGEANFAKGRALAAYFLSQIVSCEDANISFYNKITNILLYCLLINS